VTTYSIACLAGDGIGPEVMAQASRGMSAAARLHGFRLDEKHVPFGADATMRVGHPYPLASRDAALAADAILAGPIDRTLRQALEGELDLRAAVIRVRLREAATTFVAPVDAGAWDWTLERAIATARLSRGRLTLVGDDDHWAADAAAAGRDHCLDVTHLSTRRAIRALASNPDAFDVVVCDRPLLVPLAEVACLDQHRVLAWGRLAANGPGIFGPSHGTAVDIAGQGVADPSSMLLAAALMLDEGLGERGAAATLAAAVSYVRGDSTTRRAVGTVLMSTELTDAVLARLPQSHSNAEFITEVV
jgi:3-isopropylmalate dehydrogenase